MHAAAGVYSVAPLTLKISKTDRRVFADGKVTAALSQCAAVRPGPRSITSYARIALRKTISLLRCFAIVRPLAAVSNNRADQTAALCRFGAYAALAHLSSCRSAQFMHKATGRLFKITHSGWMIVIIRTPAGHDRFGIPRSHA